MAANPGTGPSNQSSAPGLLAAGGETARIAARHGVGGGRPIERPRDPRGALRRLAGYLHPHASTLAVVLFLVVAGTLLDLVGPYLMGVAIDRYITAGDALGLARIGLLMLAAYLAVWAAQAGRNYMMVTVAQRALRAVRSELFEHLQSLSLGFFDSQPQGELMSRLTNDIDAINQVISSSVVDLVASLLSLSGILVTMLVLNLWLTLGMMTIMPVVLWLARWVGRGTRRGFRQVQTNLGRLNAVTEENISGSRVVQAYVRQTSAIADFQTANLAVRDASVRAQSLALVLMPLLVVLGNMDIAIIAGFGGWLALRGLVSVGVVATFIVYARRFFRPIQSLGDMYNAILSALAGAERVFEALDRRTEVQDPPDAYEITDLKGLVQFDHVSFGYVPGVPVLSDVSFSTEPGQIIALVGPTGAGKTTMVNLLSRFYDVTEGAIRVDGRDIRTLKQDSLRSRLGVVLQDTFLFSDSVMENIRYGRLEATDEECVAAARLANADQYIRRLPEGYQTQLSERASNLSQGQRQLLAIARAALADPRILILDEATSSVDTRTEIQIQEALLRLMHGRTSFVIAHRLSTIRNADLVLVINEGRIIERGTHSSLLAQQGFYYRLYMSQFRHTGQVEQGAATLPARQPAS